MPGILEKINNQNFLTSFQSGVKRFPGITTKILLKTKLVNSFLIRGTSSRKELIRYCHLLNILSYETNAADLRKQFTYRWYQSVRCRNFVHGVAVGKGNVLLQEQLRISKWNPWIAVHLHDFTANTCWLIYSVIFAYKHKNLRIIKQTPFRNFAHLFHTPQSFR